MQTGTKGTYAKNRAIKVRVSNLTKYYGDLLDRRPDRPQSQARPVVADGALRPAPAGERR